jgi:2-dehydro-3-deoxygluconokinase
MPALQVLCLGEAMLELVSATGSATCTLGVAGDSLNTAVYLARLGIRTGFATGLGADSPASRIRALISVEGLDASFVLEKPGGSTGLYLAAIDPSGERRFTYWRDDSAPRHYPRLCREVGLVDRLCAVPVLYLTGITLAVMSRDGGDFLQTVVNGVRSAGGKVAFDPNFRPALWRGREALMRSLIGWACQNADWCLATDTDQAALWGDETPAAAFERLARNTACEVVVKCGANGCLIAPGTRVGIPGQVAVLDTTGAGDSFNAAYLAARLQGASIHDAAIAGHALAAKVIRNPGAILPRH